MAQEEALPQETPGLRLRLARTRRRLTLKTLSATTGISKSMLSGYENDDALPTTERLMVLARALGVTPDYILGFEGPTRVDLNGEPLVVAA